MSHEDKSFRGFESPIVMPEYVDLDPLSET